LVYPPSLNFTIAFLACLKAGVIAVPVFPPNPVRRDSLQMFAVIVQACDATVALTDTTYQHQKKLVSIRDALQKWTLIQRRQRTNTPTWPESLTWITTDNKTTTKLKSKTLPPLANNDETCRAQVAFLQFTSGSTSDPKGVMITHGNLAHNLHCITNELQATDDTIVVSWLPQYHDMGLIGSVLGCLYCGGTGYYMSPLSFLQRPMMWIEAISQWKATHLQAPNFAYKLTARKYLENRNTNKTDPILDLSSVRHAINAAEPVDMESISTFYQTFGPFGLKKVIYPTYGLAEHTVFVCSGGKQVLRLNKEKLESHGLVVIVDDETNENVSTMVGCGYPSNQGIDVQIVKNEISDTETGSNATAVDEDIVGEIWIRSPSKAAGYYGKPEETSEDFHACLLGPDTDCDHASKEVEGYLRTGDLGFLHNGELFICGRLKDLIIVGGRNYYPQDIESTAESSSDLVRLGCSAAFTIDPTQQGGEEVALVMELKEIPSSKDISSTCEPLANQVRSLINQDHSIGIYSIVFLKPRTAPKTSSGKIARAWCRKAYIAGTLNVVYKKSFKADVSSHVNNDQDLQLIESNGNQTTNDASSIRGMSKDAILKMLITDIARVGNVNANSIDKKASLLHMLDSLSISQFKGLLENNYAVKLSDEYLFRETTTAMKLVEVVKLGYAPDDADGSNAAAMAASTTPLPGRAKGLAGALGCPPGVVCVIM
jgi:acyl-CoA synthetase (AMP-forming)/AMP-acid ligase II